MKRAIPFPLHRQLALEEIDWIVIGGQDGEEFYGSIQFLRQVLRSLA